MWAGVADGAGEDQRLGNKERILCQGSISRLRCGLDSGQKSFAAYWFHRVGSEPAIGPKRGGESTRQNNKRSIEINPKKMSPLPERSQSADRTQDGQEKSVPTTSQKGEKGPRKVTGRRHSFLEPRPSVPPPTHI